MKKWVAFALGVAVGSGTTVAVASDSSVLGIVTDIHRKLDHLVLILEGPEEEHRRRYHPEVEEWPWE